MASRLAETSLQLASTRLSARKNLSWLLAEKYEGFLSHRGTPSYHPFISDFPFLFKHPAIKGYPNFMETPISVDFFRTIDLSILHDFVPRDSTREFAPLSYRMFLVVDLPYPSENMMDFGNVGFWITGWWCVLTILKNDGVCQWEGLFHIWNGQS